MCVLREGLDGGFIPMRGLLHFPTEVFFHLENAHIVFGKHLFVNLSLNGQR